METITVRASTSYPIMIGRGLLRESAQLIAPHCDAKRVCIVTDDIVDALHASTVISSLEGAGIEVLKFVFAHGEEQKSHSTLLEMYEFLARHNVTRSDLLIALGGGVVGDITGYCAATFLRGLRFVQIPTTLLAQVDSSVGGKTGVNIEGGKNLVGAFKQPVCVICDTDALSTLPESIFADGVAEVIKYGMIRSAPLFQTLEQGKLRERLTEVITECISIKRDVVERDEFDTGERMLLNFGHTLGHALERHYRYTGMTHGQAVAVGMCKMTRIAEREGLSAPGLSERLIACTERYGLPVADPADINTLAAYCLKDKKRAGGTMNIIYCEEVGLGKIKRLTIPEFEALITEH